MEMFCASGCCPVITPGGAIAAPGQVTYALAGRLRRAGRRSRRLRGHSGHDSGLGFVTVWWCPLAPPPRQLRYRVSFTGANPFNEAPELDDYVVVSVGSVGGVVYAGAGPDTVIGGDRVYGGRGSDSMDGVRVYGGPGSDGL